MNNTQRQPGQRRPASSIDGFSKTTRSVGRGNVGFQRNTSLQPNLSKRLDNFDRADGFQPNRTNVPDGADESLKAQKSTVAGSDEPILIEKGKTKHKRGLFRRKGADIPNNNVGRKKKKWSRKRKVVTALLIIILLFALTFGFLVLKGYINIHKVLKGGGGAAALEANVDPNKLKGEGDGRVNILLLGRGGEGHDGADLTDTIILASIDPIAKEASLVSIPRDLYVPVTNSGSMKINAVFATGKNAELAKGTRNNKISNEQAENAGFDLLEQTVEKTLGVPVHYHGMVDFSGFEQAIDTVGGVDLNAPEAVREQMRINGRNYLLDIKPGQQHMDGFKALAYSRSRHTSARGDFDRAERQRLIIVALKQKIMSAGTYSNPAKISGLLDALGGHVVTNFSIQDLQRLYDLGKQIDQSKISSIGLADPPNNYVITDTIAGSSVVVPRAGVGNYKEIQSYLRNVLKDSFIRNENASIAVYNGTATPGLATAKAEELKSFGYNVTTVDNAPTRNYTKTTLVDLRNGSKKYTKSYLEKRFGISAVTSMPDTTINPGTADFVIILGNDQADSL